MIGWLNLNEEQRKAVIDEAEQLSGITAKAIEKDWWVTLTLKALFQSAYQQHMVFKGGTSLSKCWDIIARFSEDIDIALDPTAFGMEYKESPSKGHVAKLKRNGCEFTSTLLLAEVEKQLRTLGVPDGLLTIYAASVPEDRPDTDPQTVFVKYPSLYQPNDYIADEVKIEVSVRSLRIPFTSVQIQSLLNRYNPKEVYAEHPFAVQVVESRKTLIEKVFLLHEEFGKPDKGKIRAERMSRHLYDLYKMYHTDIRDAALADHGLYEHLIQHRAWYSRISWVNYDTLAHPTISFLPVSEVLEDYRKDYQTMQEQMIYEKTAPSFNEILAGLKLLQGSFRLKHEQRSLDEIIMQAMANIEAWEEFDRVDGGVYSTAVAYVKDPNSPDSPTNKSATYKVHFIYQNGQLVFENIAIEPEQ